MHPAIRVRNLGKQYRLGLTHVRSLNEVAARWTTRLRGLVSDQDTHVAQPRLNEDRGTFWALKEIDFEIQPGEVVGVIGRNGAGKSTLLKILSRVTKPTIGEVDLRGRVGSLLEVGTGFHPELTGRENVFMNGTLLGMTKKEVERRFDEIVQFAGVERFIDTPVKRYSSGMKVRLGFAVAAHLEPEILIVDEVLAVGDAEFQRKCLRKMESAAGEGSTILLVSHNLAVIASLCGRCVLLSEGLLSADGPTSQIIDRYIDSKVAEDGEFRNDQRAEGGPKLRIRAMRITDGDGRPGSEFRLDADVFVQIDFEVFVAGRGYNVGFTLTSPQFGELFCTSVMDRNPNEYLTTMIEVGRYRSRVRLPTEILRSGNYMLHAASSIPMIEILDAPEQGVPLRLIDIASPVAMTGENRRGCIMPIIDWDTCSVS